MAHLTTKQRLLDAAEKLFAEKGFAAASLRALTTRAGVNLAAVNYHFGSKEALFRGVFARRLGPINDERVRLLDALETRAGAGPPPLEEVLEAFLAPALRQLRSPSGAEFMRLAGRIYTEPGAHWLPVTAQFDEVKQRFLAALQRALPGVAERDLMWRVHFMIGCMCHTMADTHRLELISGGLCNARDLDEILRQLVPFLAAGMRAPSLRRQEGTTA